MLLTQTILMSLCLGINASYNNNNVRGGRFGGGSFGGGKPFGNGSTSTVSNSTGATGVASSSAVEATGSAVVASSVAASSVAASSVAASSVASSTAVGVGAGTTNENTGGSGTGAASAGATLLAANIQPASDSSGGAAVEAGQSPSATDPDNFINFCTGKNTTDGFQVVTGSCNGVVMGDIPAQTDMISSIITTPAPGDVVPANTNFTISVQVLNLVAGTFTNPLLTYYSAPQGLQGGKVVGHTHVTVQSLGTSLTTTTPPDPQTFAFFKGINDDGNGEGLLSATVAGGLAAGAYRVCTLTSAANHQPVLMPVAQRGAQDDCTKFIVSDSAAGAGTGSAAGAGTGSAAASSVVAAGGSTTSTTAAAVVGGSTTTSAAAGVSTTAAAGASTGGNSGASSGQGKGNTQFGKGGKFGRGYGNGRFAGRAFVA